MTTDFWADAQRSEHDDPKLVTGPAERNRDAILDVLRRVLTEPARVVEIGSGTGQHVAHFTSAWASLTWQPTEASPTALSSIAAYRAEGDPDRFLAPVAVDITSTRLPAGPWTAVFNANVIHITPWTICEAIVREASAALTQGGTLLFYGPFRFSGSFTAPSNEAFDQSLRGRDPSWGVRDVKDISALALAEGFSEPRLFEMPANNHIIAFERT